LEIIMSKGESTKQAIVAQAAKVFNVYGYVGTSMDALTAATHLTKGGIYNHFGSKETLALAALDYSVNLARERFKEIAAGKRDTRERLLAVVTLFRSIIDEPMFEGGCPILNTAVEADDTNPALRARAQKALDDWRDYIMQTLVRGAELGTVRPGVDPDAVATIILATLEGGVMLSKLYGDSRHIAHVAEHLAHYIDSLVM